MDLAGQRLAGDAAHPPEKPRVVFDGVTKQFAGTIALGNVDLDAYPSSVHALVGENGAGKSTLMKLLSGVHRPDRGTILLDGEPFAVESPYAARALGVATVYQELNLLRNLSVAENIFFGREPRRGGFIQRRQLEEQTSALLERIGLALDPRAMCATLSIAELQFIEIAKGLSTDARVYIFDEPTAALNLRESEKLFELIEDMRRSGKLVFYVSHRLDEVMRLSDRMSVLKDGQLVRNFVRGEVSQADLVNAMVGRTLGDYFPRRKPINSSAPVRLKVSDLREKSGDAPVSLALRAGEIVGLEGQGQRQIMRGTVGLTRPTSGRIELLSQNGTKVLDPSWGHVRIIREGIGFVPESRQAEGLFLDLPIDRNVALGGFRTSGIFSKARRNGRRIRDILKGFRLKSASLSQNVSELSGGNQQKVMLGRWILSDADVLLIEEPTRGVDVGARAEIYENIRHYTEAGGAVLIASSDLMEIIGLCDRILVVRDKMIVAEMPGEGATETAVMEKAVLVEDRK